MTVKSPTPGRGVAVVDLSPALHNPNGVVHSAVLFAMADTSMGAATMSILDDGLACASIEVHVRFLRAAATGRLTAETEVLKRGRRVVQLASRILDERDEAVAMASGSFAVLPVARELNSQPRG